MWYLYAVQTSLDPRVTAITIIACRRDQGPTADGGRSSAAGTAAPYVRSGMSLPTSGRAHSVESSIGVSLRFFTWSSQSDVTYAHDALAGPVAALLAIFGVDLLILKVGKGHVNEGRRCVQEAEMVVPRHVLDAQQRSVGRHDIVKVAVCDEHSVGFFDDLGQDFVDGVEAQVLVALEHGAGTFLPAHALRRVHGSLDVGTVEVETCSGIEVIQIAGEAEHVGQQRASCGDHVLVEAGIHD